MGAVRVQAFWKSRRGSCSKWKCRSQNWSDISRVLGGGRLRLPRVLACIEIPKAMAKTKRKTREDNKEQGLDNNWS